MNINENQIILFLIGSFETWTQLQIERSEYKNIDFSMIDEIKKYKKKIVKRELKRLEKNGNLPM